MFYEVAYRIPFNVLFSASMDENGEYTKGVAELCKSIDTYIDFDWLDKQFEDREHERGDVHVFWGTKSEEFIMLDLYCGLTDQHCMVRLGIHVDVSKEQKIKEIMQEIYNDEDAIPKSDFNEYRSNEIRNEINPLLFPEK